jgi:hypothetical protein
MMRDEIGAVLLRGMRSLGRRPSASGSRTRLVLACEGHSSVRALRARTNAGQIFVVARADLSRP